MGIVEVLLLSTTAKNGRNHTLQEVDNMWSQLIKDVFDLITGFA